MLSCEGFWGGTALSTAPLRISVIPDAIYVPFRSNVYMDRDPEWGIYDATGHLVLEAAYVRGEAQELVGQSRRIDPGKLNLQEAPANTLLYAGPIVLHYGHFLLASLARLWAFDGSAPALFHSHPALFENAESYKYIRTILAAAGLTPRNAMSLAQPTRIKRLVVPEPSVIEQCQVSPIYAASVGRVGAAFGETGRFNDGRYYLSKSQLTSGVAGFQDEVVVEQAFARRGFDIVHPETLSIADQVSLFRNAALLAGTVSSAFHTVALTPYAVGRRVIFDYNNTPNANFALLDHGSMGQSIYRTMFGNVRETSRPGFLSWYEANDIGALAEAMADVADQ